MSAYENPNCGRCGKKVYHAERMAGANTYWHKVGCYTCKVCNVRLSSTTAAEANDGIIKSFNINMVAAI